MKQIFVVLLIVVLCAAAIYAQEDTEFADKFGAWLLKKIRKQLGAPDPSARVENYSDKIAFKKIASTLYI